MRSDEELKEALRISAARSDRKEADQARFLLRLALGLTDDRESRDAQARMREHEMQILQRHVAAHPPQVRRPKGA